SILAKDSKQKQIAFIATDSINCKTCRLITKHNCKTSRNTHVL
ncbi:hypothetical protein HMPREF3216_00561, partial [Gardnerella vaginalis]